METRQCLRCGATGLYLDHGGNGSSDSPVLACNKCGERYYKKYPKRTAEYELCVKCGVFFRRARKDQDICPNCEVKFEARKEARAEKKQKKKDNYANLF